MKLRKEIEKILNSSHEHKHTISGKSELNYFLNNPKATKILHSLFKKWALDLVGEDEEEVVSDSKEQYDYDASREAIIRNSLRKAIKKRINEETK